MTIPCCGNGQPITFSILTRDDNVPIGYVTLKGITHDEAKAELGIAIMDSHYRSRGYGSDALFLVTDYAFNKLRLSALGLTVFPENIRAIKSYEKAGFQTVSILKRAWTMPGGEKEDMMLMELRKKTGR